MTIIINLFGGPGIGKSTTAAALFSHLKQKGVNCELVSEFVKEWAWEKRTIGPCDQFYFFGEQTHREQRLLGKVDYIITDSPVALGSVYAKRYAPVPVAKAIIQSTRAYVECVRSFGHDFSNILLYRQGTFVQDGRYEDEVASREIDKSIIEVLTFDLEEGLVEVPAQSYEWFNIFEAKGWV